MRQVARKQKKIQPHTDDPQQERKLFAPYMKSVLSTRVWLFINEIGSNLKRNLEKVIVAQTEGKCIVEGYVRPNSVSILSYSSGKISGDKIEFQCVYECKVCHPVEGMLIECTCKTLTKAGIHAIVEDPIGQTILNPIVVFVARDHHLSNHTFDEVREGAKLQVRVIGIRYELNDTHICAIGKLVDSTA